jgi:hypothetical protein
MINISERSAEAADRALPGLGISMVLSSGGRVVAGLPRRSGCRAKVPTRRPRGVGRGR